MGRPAVCALPGHPELFRDLRDRVAGEDEVDEDSAPVRSQARVTVGQEKAFGTSDLDTTDPGGLVLSIKCHQPYGRIHLGLRGGVAALRLVECDRKVLALRRAGLLQSREHSRTRITATGVSFRLSGTWVGLRHWALQLPEMPKRESPRRLRCLCRTPLHELHGH